MLLTVGGELDWGQSTKRAVWPVVVIVMLPCLQHLPNLIQRSKLINVQTLITQSAVKSFNQPVLGGFARPDEVELHAPQVAD